MIRISAEYDHEALMWVAQSDDIPLITEAESVEALRKKLPGMILDLVDNPAPDLQIELTAHIFDRVAVPKAA